MNNRLKQLLQYPMHIIAKRVINQIDYNSKQEVLRRNENLLDRLNYHGSGIHLNGDIHLTGHENVNIGHNVHIGDGAFIRGEGGLSIGDNTHISRNLVLYTVNHDYMGMLLPYDENLVERPVNIGRNVWIGMNVCIAPGTEIGDGSIIGIGTVLFGSIPPLAIVGSAKWRQIGTRDMDHYMDLDNSQSFGGVNGRPI